MTPLDFRLIASSIFRMFAAHCSETKKTTEDVSLWFSKAQMLALRLLSSSSFDAEAENLAENFYRSVIAQQSSQSKGNLAMLTIRLSGLTSAMGTNAFVTMEPESHQHQTITNLYPVLDGVPVTGVSFQSTFLE
jgi:hypothetical protein